MGRTVKIEGQNITSVTDVVFKQLFRRRDFSHVTSMPDYSARAKEPWKDDDQISPLKITHYITPTGLHGAINVGNGRHWFTVWFTQAEINKLLEDYNRDED